MVMLETQAPEPDLVLPTRWRKAPDARGVPCSFSGRGLDFDEFAAAKEWYDLFFSWRYEMGSLRTSLRYNQKCWRLFCWHHKLGSPIMRKAARAGVERAIWELTGKVVKLHKRPRPSVRRVSTNGV